MDFEKLINPGLLSIKPYVPGKSVNEVLRERGTRDVVKMASNENPLGVSPAAVEALRGAVSGVSVYPEVSCPELAEALAHRFRIERDNIIAGNGADGVIYTLGMTLLEKGDEAILPSVTFPMYEIVIKEMGAKPVRAPMRGYGIDLQQILKRVNRRTKMIWLSNPNNPTGTLIERHSLTRFMEQLPDHVLVAHDEVYSDFADPLKYPDTVRMLLEGRENLFLIRSFSKIYGLAGLRVGYGIGPEPLIKLMYRVRPPFDVSVPAQTAAVAALGDVSFYERTLEITRGGKEYLYRSLDALGLSYVPSHTNFILIDTGMDDGVVCNKLLERGIIARPAGSYDLPDHIRITVGLQEHNEKFIHALKEILNERSCT